MTVLEAGSAVDKFDAPLYTQAEASRFLASPSRRSAAGRADRRSLSSELRRGYALAAIRRTGVPLQRIRPALERLDTEMGIEHARASEKLLTDGVEVLFDYAGKAAGDEADAVRELVVVRHGQRVFPKVASGYLQRIVFGADGFATALPLPGFQYAQLIADVRRSFGQPIFAARWSAAGGRPLAGPGW